MQKRYRKGNLPSWLVATLAQTRRDKWRHPSPSEGPADGDTPSTPSIASSHTTPLGAQPTGRPIIAKHKVKSRTEPLNTLCSTHERSICASRKHDTLPTSTLFSCFREPYIKTKHISGCRICTNATGVNKSTPSTILT